MPFVLLLFDSASRRLARVSLGEDDEEEEGAQGAEGSRERRSEGL